MSGRAWEPSAGAIGRAVITIGDPAVAAEPTVEIIGCQRAEEVTAHLAGGRPFAALVVAARSPALDRDLVGAATAAGCPVVAVGPVHPGRDCTAMGVAAVVNAGCTTAEILAVTDPARCLLAAACTDPAPRPAAGPTPALLVAVTGPGGTGASTVAMALGRGLAAHHRTVLADLRFHAELAFLHRADGAAAGLEELVHACATGHAPDRSAWSVPTSQRYRLVVGVHARRAWTAIRPHAFAAALEAMRTAFEAVVADVEPDVEGEDETGSIDVEERNAMARTTVGAAGAVVVVGAPGPKGARALGGVVAELLAFGVESARVIAVVNRAHPEGVRPAHGPDPDPRPPILLPDLGSGASSSGLPFLRPVTCRHLLAAVLSAGRSSPEPRPPRRVIPGRVGAWGE